MGNNIFKSKNNENDYKKTKDDNDLQFKQEILKELQDLIIKYNDCKIPIIKPPEPINVVEEKKIKKDVDVYTFLKKHKILILLNLVVIAVIVLLQPFIFRVQVTSPKKKNAPTIRKKNAVKNKKTKKGKK